MFWKNKSVLLTPVNTFPVIDPGEKKEDEIKVSWGAHVSVLLDQALKAALILTAAQTARGIITHIVVTKVR